MTGQDEEIQVPVLIVGGSLVGLSTALLLARHGVESLVVERRSGTAIHPRAGWEFASGKERAHLGKPAEPRARRAR